MAAVSDAAALDIKSDVLVTKFVARIADVAVFSREVCIPSEAGMPQMFANGFKNAAALVSGIDCTFKEVEEVKTFLEDLDAYVAANPVATVPTGGVLIISHNKEVCDGVATERWIMNKSMLRIEGESVAKKEEKQVRKQAAGGHLRRGGTSALPRGIHHTS